MAEPRRRKEQQASNCRDGFHGINVPSPVGTQVSCRMPFCFDGNFRAIPEVAEFEAAIRGETSVPVK